MTELNSKYWQIREKTQAKLSNIKRYEDDRTQTYRDTGLMVLSQTQLSQPVDSSWTVQKPCDYALRDNNKKTDHYVDIIH